MQNKKGFTLVELLAVIVILAIVMVLATTAVGPLMEKSRKGSLGTEGLSLVDSAKLAYQAEQMLSTGAIAPTDSACFSLNWLINNHYYEKKNSNNYTGSVLIEYSGGTYIYTFWISNGQYAYENVEVGAYGYDKAKDQKSASANCGGKTVNKTRS